MIELRKRTRDTSMPSFRALTREELLAWQGLLHRPVQGKVPYSRAVREARIETLAREPWKED